MLSVFVLQTQVTRISPRSWSSFWPKVISSAAWRRWEGSCS